MNPGLYRRLVPGGRARAVAERCERGAAQQPPGQGGPPLRRLLLAAVGRPGGPGPTSLTRLVDLHNAPVCNLLYEPEQGGLVVTEARVLVVGANVINPNGLAGQRGADQALPEVLAALEAQHGGQAVRCRRLDPAPTAV